MRFILLLLSILYAAPGWSAERLLPLTLNVLNYDTKLKAFLLSGDYRNNLLRPIRAWRGELLLRDKTNAEHSTTFFLEQQAKRPIPPDGWGVWSVWIDFKPDVPEHQALKTMQREQLDVELRLLRVLYLNGEQQAF